MTEPDEPETFREERRIAGQDWTIRSEHEESIEKPKFTNWWNDLDTPTTLTITPSTATSFTSGGSLAFTGTTEQFFIYEAGSSWIKIKPKKANPLYHDPWAEMNRAEKRAHQFNRRTRMEGWENDRHIQGRKFSSQKCKARYC
jgi:hypothetical protein